jgi:hypothetical protein
MRNPAPSGTWFSTWTCFLVLLYQVRLYMRRITRKMVVTEWWELKTQDFECVGCAGGLGDDALFQPSVKQPWRCENRPKYMLPLGCPWRNPLYMACLGKEKNLEIPRNILEDLTSLGLGLVPGHLSEHAGHRHVILQRVFTYLHI